jgi:hypothetical protein
MKVEATSTNDEIFIVPITGGTAKKISTSPGSTRLHFIRRMANTLPGDPRRARASSPTSGGYSCKFENQGDAGSDGEV